MKKINISGVIGWDVEADDIRERLDSAMGDDVEIMISSPGGLISTGLEIFNLIRNYSGNTTAILSGYAMSMASYIPLAADKVIVEDNAVFMIHNAGGGVFGDHKEILHYGDYLKGLSTMIAKAYSKFTGKSVEELSAMMDDETFFYGSDIVEAGFAHEMIESDGESDKDTNMSLAKMKFNEVTAKLVKDQEAMKKDLTRASAMALGEIKKAVVTPQKEDSIMDLKELKAKHPDLVAAIIEEATAGHADALTTARAEGASTEGERIKSVHAQMFPGHEDIVSAAMFDGTSQAGDIAIAINAANIEATAKAGEDASDDAPNAVVEPAGEKPQAKKPGKNATAKERWDASESLQNDFDGDFEAYEQYAKADADGKIRMSGGSK